MTEGVVTYVESRANGGRKFIFVLVKYDALGIYLSILKCGKSLAEGSCGEEAILLIIALEHRKKLTVELALHRHISLEALGVMKGKRLVLYLKGIKLKGVAAEISRDDKSGIDIAGKLYVKCGLGAVLFVGDKSADAADNLAARINAGDVDALLLEHDSAECKVLRVHRHLTVLILYGKQLGTADAGLVKAGGLESTRIAVERVAELHKITALVS